MAIRYAVANGNWSNTATWDGGTLPAVDDDVYANGKTVTIDIDVTINSLNNQVITSPSILIGGSFTLNDGVTVTATSGFTPRQTLLNITGTNSATLIGDINPSTGGTTTVYGVYMQDSSNITITGSVYGGRSSTNIGVQHISSGQLNVLGNVEGFLTTNCLGIRKLNSGTININGNVLSSQIAAVNGIFVNSGASIINITGSLIGIRTAAYQDNSTGNGTVVNISGSIVTTDIPTISAFYKTTTGTLTVIGPVYAGNNATGITATQANVYATGPFYNRNGKNAIYTQQLELISGSTPTWTFDTETYGEQRILYTLDYPGNFPSFTDVRDGIIFGDTNQFTGTVAIPPTGSVLKGVPVDNTTGSASFDIQNAWNADINNLTTTGSLGARLKNVATVATTGDAIASKGNL